MTVSSNIKCLLHTRSYLRDRVLAACFTKEGSQRQIATRFKVSLSFVRNLLRRYRTSGESEAKR